MIVFDDVIYSLQKNGGGSTYWRNLTVGVENSGICSVVRVGKHGDSLSAPEEFQLSILDRFRDPLARNDFNADIVLHSSYYRISTRKGVKNVVTIHDFIPEKKMSVFRAVANYIVKFRCTYYAHVIICVSEATKSDLFRFFPWLRKNKVVVIHNWIAKEFTNNRLSREGYYLFVGARRSYKGFDVALRHVAVSPVKRLIVVGADFSAAEKALINSFPKVEIELYSGISNRELSLLYNRAYALLHPSNYEGFGLTVIEAFACGCPVIGQNCSAVDEITSQWDLLYNEPTDNAFLEKDHLLRENYEYYSEKASMISLNFRETSQLKKYLHMYQSLL